MDQEDTSHDSEVIELITCNICHEFIGAEIFQCVLGHIYCFHCARSLTTCASCRSPMPNSGPRTGIRNRALEKLLSHLGDLPCLQDGCDVRLPFRDLPVHYLRCPHRIIKCPCNGCVWTGPISSIETHLLGAHDDIISNTTGIIELRVRNPTGLAIDGYAEKLIEYQGNHFLLSIWLIRGQRTSSSLTCCVTYLGADAGSIKTTLMADSRHYGCSFSCEKRPWTLTDDLQEVRRSNHNLVIDWGTALRIGESEPLYRDLDQLRVEPRMNSLDLPLSLSIRDTSGEYHLREEDVEPIVLELVDIEQQESNGF